MKGLRRNEAAMEIPRGWYQKKFTIITRHVKTCFHAKINNNAGWHQPMLLQMVRKMQQDRRRVF